MKLSWKETLMGFLLKFTIAEGVAGVVVMGVGFASHSVDAYLYGVLLLIATAVTWGLGWLFGRLLKETPMEESQ